MSDLDKRGSPDSLDEPLEALIADATARIQRHDELAMRAPRAVVCAYVLGCKDAQRLAAGVAWSVREDRAEDLKQEERRGVLVDSERAAVAVAAEILEEILRLDPTRARPALEVLLAEPGGPCPLCDDQGGPCPLCDDQGLMPPAVKEMGGPVRGNPIVTFTCPCCGASLDVTHGDDLRGR